MKKGTDYDEHDEAVKLRERYQDRYEAMGDDRETCPENDDGPSEAGIQREGRKGTSGKICRPVSMSLFVHFFQ